MKGRRRPYRLQARADSVAQTRARIVDATVALHAELGPAHTTISAIAERAGVERLTVYRHFPDERTLLRACSGRWLEQNPPPDPAGWQPVADPTDRTLRALTQLYSYFLTSERMLVRVYRDLPDSSALAEVTQGFENYLIAVAEGLWESWANVTPAQPELRNALRTVVRFPFWAALAPFGSAEAAKARLVTRWIKTLSYPA
jgi:AcrR family transcriptional regulator